TVTPKWGSPGPKTGEEDKGGCKTPLSVLLKSRQGNLTTKGGSDKVVTQTPTDQEQAVVETMEGKYRVVLDYLGLRIFTDPLDTADEALGLVNAFAHNEEGTAPKVSSIQKYNLYEGS